MTSTPLSYMPAPPAGSQRWWALAIVAAALFLIFVLPILTMRRVETRIDPISGSMSYQTVWWLGITSGTSTDVSPLESRLNRSGIQWTRSWQFLTSKEYKLFVLTMRGCSSTPPIYQLRPVLKDFANASTDRELRDFVRVMQSGTQAAQTAAIDAAFERAMQASSGQ
jgi:hypothetical protein